MGIWRALVGMMAKRILVTAACTADAIAAGLRLLLPDFDVQWRHVAPLLSADPDPELEQMIRDADHWIYLRRPETVALSQRLGHGVAVPEIAFNAFHPDEVASHHHGGVVMGPTDSLHSAIGIWAFTNGYGARDAAQLFTSRAFEDLGYLDCWASSAAELEKSCQDTAVDYDRMMRHLKRKMPFMTTVSHPQVTVTAEIARHVAEKLGYRGDPSLDPIEDFITDPMRALVWPVYPAVAERYGFRGSMRWRSGETIYSDVESYLDACYKSYAAYDGGVFCDRLNGTAYQAILGRYL